MGENIISREFRTLPPSRGQGTILLIQSTLWTPGKVSGVVSQDYLVGSKEVNQTEEARMREKPKQEIEDSRKALIYLEDSSPGRTDHASQTFRTDLIGHRDGSRPRAVRPQTSVDLLLRFSPPSVRLLSGPF